VANYSDFWDGYPNRAKNYWLYQSPRGGKWVFIPWDLNETFNPVRGYFNNMGTDCNYLFMYDESNMNRYYTSVYRTNDNGKSEITPRPLFTRIMNVAKFKSLHASMYKQALSACLGKETVLGLIDSLAARVNQSGLSRPDSLDVDTSVNDMKLFVQNRTQSLEKQLSDIPVLKPFVQKPVSAPFFHFTSCGSLTHMINNSSAPLVCTLYRADGRSLARLEVPARSWRAFDAPASGILMYDLRETGGGPLTRGLITVR
jgi:hypothetical protein